ncbi:uncharacterized protein JCM10292_007156 [Rhodotorula paludigena]|uniref:uncharacterized protein n=1 Tax=Rhodotorula paludigena TaxID=86838 RepID=UPI003181EEEC
MVKDKAPPAQPATLDSFFRAPKRTASSNSQPTSPAKIARTAPKGTPNGAKGIEWEGQSRAGKAGAVETMVLDDSDDSDDADGLVVVDPGSAGQSATRLAKVREDDGGSKPPKPAAPVAPIFAKRTPASPSTPAKPSPAAQTGSPKLTGTVKGEGKPTPTKNISIFDTTAAGASTSASASASSSSASQPLPPSKPLDTPLFSFLPSSDVHFAAPAARLPFAFLTDALVRIGSTRSRLEIQLVLTNLLRTVIEKDPDSLVSVIYLLSNRIGPSYEKDTELGIGWQVLSKAIKETSGISSQRLKQLANQTGDPGDLAFEASKSVRLLVQPAPLDCMGVYATLLQIARLKGTGVLAQKTSLVKSLILRSRGAEVRYLVRILSSNLRIGAVRLTLLTALARAFVLARPGAPKDAGGALGVSAEEWRALAEGEEEERRKAEEKSVKREEADAGSPSKAKGKGKGKAAAATSSWKPKSKPRAQKTPLELDVDARFKRAEALVRRVWARHPNFGHLVEALKEGGLEELEERVGLSVGIPLEPMLGSITRSLSDIYTRLGSRPFVAEAKLDGQRGQIHVSVSATRPAGVADGSGKFFVDDATGTRVWVRMFSRHLEDMSEKYPDIGETILGIVRRAQDDGERLELRNFVIDCEVVAIDPQTGAFKTFQELSYRSKKDVELGDIKVRVGIFCFDLMYLNDESLLSTPFRQRRHLLHTHFSPLRPTDARFAKWELIPSCTDNDPARVREFFDECVRSKAEGIMVKLLDEVPAEVEGEGEAAVKREEEDEEEEAGAGGGTAGEEDDEEDGTRFEREASASSSASSSASRDKGKARAAPASSGGGTAPSKAAASKGRRKALPATYEPDKRADSWLKCKKDYLEADGVAGDSLDLVPIAAWHGQGRKAGWWSPFLLACYDEETGAYTAVTKVLSGFTDAFYKSMREKYNPDPDNPLTDTSPWPEVEAGGLSPDIWFKPSEVWEIRGADFTLSPVYPAARAQLHSARGVSVRFPRFLRVRDDKAVENATTAAQLAGMYEAQMRDAPAFRPEAKAGGEEGEGERGEEKGEDAEDE